MVLRQMLHIQLCIFDAIAGGPQEKFYRIFTAMMIIFAYAHVAINEFMKGIQISPVVGKNRAI